MNRDFVSLKEVFGPSGKDRLRLLHESDDDEFEEFHSLSWDFLTKNGWMTKVRLTDEQFQGHYLYHRRIADVHSLQPENGFAVIMVAEANRNEGNTQYDYDYNYSWRIWDMVKNSEVARLKDCQTPSDALVYQ